MNDMFLIKYILVESYLHSYFVKVCFTSLKVMKN